MSDRCEPPEHLRDRDGWHWVQAPVGEPHLARWHAAERPDVEPLWTSTHHVYSGTPRYAVREWGWRYVAPVVTPAEVDALRAERDALVTELYDLRCLAECEPDHDGPDVWQQNAALRARVEVLEEVLRQIEGGFVPGGGNLVAAGSWQGFVEALQDIARAALGDKP